MLHQGDLNDRFDCPFVLQIVQGNLNAPATRAVGVHTRSPSHCSHTSVLVSPTHLPVRADRLFSANLRSCLQRLAGPLAMEGNIMKTDLQLQRDVLSYTHLDAADDLL